ncbi:MAG TPA: prepilin-type N-terminal cleavage/methylation domain-containing protein [Terriglobales bacterium]|jgi:general secretion pathway protein G|nr:prepilin-type N-terminal cleavage/methylation domain-containing protein [Terriglobales bacterium]
MRVPSKSGARGFTLIEMVVVIALILVLLSISLPMYNQAILHAREAKMHSNVATLNKVIEAYSFDKKRAPQVLDDLIQAGYLKYIPEDITGRSDTWVTELEDPQKAWDPNQPGIGSAHSGSNEISSEGTPYSSWTH